MDRKIEKKKWPPKKIALYGGVAAVVLVVGYMLAFGDRSSRLYVDPDKHTISTVEFGEFQEWIPVNGTVEPIKTVYLDAIEGGQVEEIFVEEGATVEAGDPLVRLNNTNLLLDIMYREAELFQQINNLRNTRITMEQRKLELQGRLLDLDFQIREAKRRHERYQELAKSGLVSEEERQQADEDFEYLVRNRELTLETFKQDSMFRKIQIESLEGSVHRMETNLEVVRKKMENLTIRAPIRGQLTALDAEIGQNKPQGTRLGQIDQLDGFQVACLVDEYYLSRVSSGLRGTFTFANDDFELRSTKVYPQVRDGRFEVEMSFTGSEPEGIRRGQTVRVRLELGDPTEAIMIPRGGFFQSTGGRWIFVVDPSGEVAIRRDIQLGQMNARMFEVLGGVEPGERVVTSSYDNFGDVDKLVFEKEVK